MDSRTCQDRQPSDHPSSSSSNCSSSKSNCERERIRSQMKMVIGQLEGILQELKEVAKELREVVSQIDRLTSDFEFELEPDDWTTATVSSTSSSEKGGGAFELGPLDFSASDILSDSWEFCSFLDASTPSDPGDGPEPPRPQPQPPCREQPEGKLRHGVGTQSWGSCTAQGKAAHLGARDLKPVAAARAVRTRLNYCK
ncbi:PREDICTED: UPF0583 protein C15orf59 homolog [Pygoscelis adeliae]|uniref:UPF0583 protein C15orf59 homolog n=1 Tax=Pygoscelis adeliae TaxID=9238 RepID=UPI0004F4DC87|nr:PREDICTED: UPF0583 protein C15orf59 homolog [Pygoscelis adeliae]